MKKFLKITAILLFSIVLALTVAVYALSDKIQQAVLKEINEQLAVEGSFKNLDVTFWKTFPKVALRMEGLTLRESETLLDTFLLEADEFYLQFNLTDALVGKYELEKVKAHNLTLRLATKGSAANYQLFKNSSTDSISDERIKIDLSSIELSNALIEYHDLEGKTTIIYDFERLESRGRIESDKIDFGVQAQGQGKTFVVKSDTLAVTKSTALKVQLLYETNTDKLSVKKGTLDIEKTILGIDGYFIFGNTDSVDIRLESKKNKINKVAGLLPKNIGKELNSFKTEGDFSVKAHIAGSFAAENMPSIDAQVKIINGKLLPKAGQDPLEQINLNANLLFGKNTEYIQIPAFSFKLGEHTFKGSFDLNNFKDPYISGDFTGKINLSHVNKLFDLKETELSGLVDCNFNLKGRISELSTGKQFQEKGIHGHMKWENISFKSYHEMLKDWNVSDCNASWKMNGNQIAANNVSGKLNGADFTLNISLDKLLPYIFKDSKAEIFADLQTEKLELPPSLFGEKESKEGTKTDLFTLFPARAMLDITFNIGDFKAKDIEFTHLKGELFASSTRIDLSNFSGNGAEGHFSGSVSLRKRVDEQLFGEIALAGNNLNVNTLFKMFDNFGQEEITHKNLEGRLDITTQMVLLFEREGTVAKENMYAFTDLTIRDGMLKNYEAMKSLSDYAEVSELENIRFGLLTNTFEIRDGEINFPFMDIGNNVMNVRIKGNHRFDNYMDYTFRVNLSEALAAKYKIRTKRSREDFEDLGDKGIALYLRMTGYADDLKFKLEKIGGKPVLVPETVTEEIKSAREEFKQTIKQEFSTEQREERKKQEAEKEKVEWDE